MIPITVPYEAKIIFHRGVLIEKGALTEGVRYFVTLKQLFGRLTVSYQTIVLIRIRYFKNNLKRLLLTPLE